MEVTQRSVSTDNAPGGRTNAYVLGTGPSILVDPGARTEGLDRIVQDRNVAHVLVTHAHPDHAGAVSHYADVTDATVWARRGFEDRFRTVTGVEPDRTMVGGQRIPLGEENVFVMDTPGHAPDHVALIAGVHGPICCGDCAARDSSVMVGAPDGDMRAYLTTLRRLRTTNAPHFLPGHGPPIATPVQAIEGLLHHRLERERRVLQAVEVGARTSEDILGLAYDADLSEVRDMARATVVCHLEKLDVEGKLVWDGQRVSKSGP